MIILNIIILFIINWRPPLSLWIFLGTVFPKDYHTLCRWVIYRNCSDILRLDRLDILILGSCWPSGKRYIRLYYMRKVILSSEDWRRYLEKPFQRTEILFETISFWRNLQKILQSWQWVQNPPFYYCRCFYLFLSFYRSWIGSTTWVFWLVTIYMLWFRWWSWFRSYRGSRDV